MGVAARAVGGGVDVGRHLGWDWGEEEECGPWQRNPGTL